MRVGADEISDNTQSMPSTQSLSDGSSHSRNLSDNARRRSSADVWRSLRSKGLTARDWADEHGYEPALVYAVLSGTRKCLRGKSFEIAAALGIKWRLQPNPKVPEIRWNWRRRPPSQLLTNHTGSCPSSMY